MTSDPEKKRAIAALREAYQSLKDARVHCDAAYQTGGVHYNDVTQVMQTVDKMISALNRKEIQ